MENNNQFLELINNPMLNTDNTIRYCLMHQAKTEDLARHITDVSVLSYLLALRFNSYGDGINIGTLLEKILLHDLDEVLTGDIPRSTKYYSEAGLHAMKDIARDSMVKLLSTIPGSDGVIEKWDNAKKGKEGTILVLSDMLCVARKCVIEVKLLGNGYFLKVAYEMVDNLKELAQTDYSDFSEETRIYIQGLIHDAVEVMSSLIAGDDRFSRFGIEQNVFRA